MKSGFLPEILVICGAYLSGQSLPFSIVLIALGCLGGIFRFAAGFNTAAKKEQLYETVNTFIKKIIEKPIYSVDLSSFTQSNDEVH